MNTASRKSFQRVKSRYDYILIDCPPALDLLTLNALVAAESVLIPIQCEFFALEGISQLMDTIDKIREAFSHPLKIQGILLTMYDERTNLTRQVADDLRDFFHDEVLTTVIPRSIRLAEAPSYGKPILMYDPRSRGAESYIKLAKEILENEQRNDKQRKVLGKGLSALLPGRSRSPHSPLPLSRRNHRRHPHVSLCPAFTRIRCSPARCFRPTGWRNSRHPFAPTALFSRSSFANIMTATRSSPVSADGAPQNWPA